MSSRNFENGWKMLRKSRNIFQEGTFAKLAQLERRRNELKRTAPGASKSRSASMHSRGPRNTTERAILVLGASVWSLLLLTRMHGRVMKLFLHRVSRPVSRIYLYNTCVCVCVCVYIYIYIYIHTYIYTYIGDFTALDWVQRRETHAHARTHTERSRIRASKAWRSEKCWKLDIQFVQGRAIPVEILLSSRVAPLCIRCRGVTRLDKSPDKTADNAESIVFTKGSVRPSPPPPSETPPPWSGVSLA